MDYQIERELRDIRIMKPQAVDIGDLEALLYPVTLGDLDLRSEYIENLGLDKETTPEDAYKAISEHREDAAQIIAIQTFKKSSEKIDPRKRSERARKIESNCTDEDLASLLFICLDQERKLKTYQEYLGISEDMELKAKAMAAKKDTGNTLSFGCRSTFGSLYDMACQRYHWTVDYINWGISYILLRLMLADGYSYIYLTDEEKRKGAVYREEEKIDGNDPNNRDAIIAFLQPKKNS